MQTNKKFSLPVMKQPVQHIEDRETSSRIRVRASYAAETSVILPFFAAFMVFLLFFFRVLQAQQVVGNALSETGRELAVLAYEETSGRGHVGLPLAKITFLAKLKEKALVDQFVCGGALGISMIRSDFSGNYVELTADYTMRLPTGLFGRQDIAVTQRVKYRKWTGNSNTEEQKTEDEIVYLTPSGTVYHRDKNCSYLKPSVSQASADVVKERRNASGGKYYGCFSCIESGKTYSILYITEYGTRYHSRIDCPKLKRTIYAVRLSEVRGKHACSKCAGL